ncbi:MAG TPA: hypothetical protein VHO70_22020 [Chitinispirillaceae bacterium]|nr:hypothetical protein [Chitinispirillaceae bacterium]
MNYGKAVEFFILYTKNFLGFSQYPVRKYVKITDPGSTGTARRVSRTGNAHFFIFAIVFGDKFPGVI